jgi:uncharacterized protein
MELERLEPAVLIKSLKTGCGYLELNRDILDNLNVYPVPDGDTGINMVLTFKPAVEEIANSQFTSLSDLSTAMTTMLAKNSRGNSGFILAQFFRGFWEAAAAGKNGYIDTTVLKHGFEKGAFTSVSSLLSPSEGTMITIIASMLDAMKALNTKNVIHCFESAVETGLRSLFKTPEQLPILAEAGVVDAGALGFIFIIKGMLCGLIGNDITAECEDEYRFTPEAIVSGGTTDTDLPAAQMVFRYCLELDIETSHAAKAPPDEFKSFLLQNGGSIALIADDCRLKIHVHTNVPDCIIEKSETIGSVTHSKIDDMADQVAGVKRSADGSAAGSDSPDNPSVLSIIPGPGFRRLFEELGASDCHEYSQTLPSVNELSKSVDRMQGDEIIILPNNANIIPIIRLVNERTKKNVTALQTKNVVDGITAMYGYFETGSVEQNILSMSDCIGLAVTLKLFISSREAMFGQMRIENGHYFVTKDDELLATAASLEDAMVTAIKKIDTVGKSNISLYYSDDFDVGGMGRLKDRIAETDPNLEFEQHYGGQDKSILIISIE